MNKNKIVKKSLAVGIIALFLGMSAISTAGNYEIKNILREKDINNIYKETNLQSNLKPFWQLSGTKGENGWYITCVTLTFIYDPGEVKEIWIRITGGSWELYTGTKEICKEGSYTVAWKWIDHDDREYIETPIRIKIDRTPPTISLKKQIDSETQITFTAKANDVVSGIQRVDFFVNEEYMGNDTEWPYVYVWEGTTHQTIKAVAYDYAGWSAFAESNTKPRSRNYMFKEVFLSQPLRNLLNIILLSQKIFFGSIL